LKTSTYAVQSDTVVLLILCRVDRRSVEGSDEDQPVIVGARQCHLGSGRRQVETHSVSRLKADADAAGLAWRQHQDVDGGVSVASRQQLRRDAEHAALRQPRQEHQEQTEDQRRSKGRPATRVPGRNQPAESNASWRHSSPD